MHAWVSLPLAAFLAAPPEAVVARLADAQSRRNRATEPAQSGAWDAQVDLLRAACAGLPGDWRLLLEYDLLRLERRVDAVLLTDRAVLVLEFKVGARRHEAPDLRQAEDYALCLHDFHAGSRAHPVVPVLVATAAPALPWTPPLLWHGVTPPLRAGAATLGAVLRAVHAAVPAPAVPLDPDAWEAAPYRPVPTIVEAATRLYAGHGVAEIAHARADVRNLTDTTAAIRRAVAAAETAGEHRVVFVTGIPGAGKTLCGLDVVFGAARDLGAAFLTGNVPLVAVLREALAADAARGRPGAGVLALERRRTGTALQNVHRFLEHHALRPAEAPPERVVVFDEAQRAWDAAKATRDGQHRASRLTDSEPAHMLEAMGRHADWAVVVALVGSGQEINVGEAGLAEWGRAIAASGGRWRAVAPPDAVGPGPPARRLAAAPAPWLATDPALHLSVPVRAVRDARAAPWVEAVLEGDRARARAVADAAPNLPILLTRDLGALRAGLRARRRGERRVGLVASSGNRRLRAEGLAADLRGDDAVTDWFLRRWPDVRASDALEVTASEYACQGLELDVVGLAWGGDLRWRDGAWRVHAFAGTRWTGERGGAARDHALNTYRVLLTRARHETLVWVPRGDPGDGTREPADLDAVADFLRACGAVPLPEAAPAPAAAPALL